MALVGKLWHNALAPTAGACMPALTRQITLGAQDMHNVALIALIARSWCVWIRARKKDRGIITDAALGSLAAGCPNITCLNLQLCQRITDTGVARLAAALPALTTLNLVGCYAITDTGLASLAAGCPAITTLDLSGCCNITAAGLASLAECPCPAITTLILKYCRRITDTGLEMLVAGCPAITSLDLDNCILKYGPRC